jgi:hypothetical protein
MFGQEMPAGLLYARHVNGVDISRLKVSFERPDERPMKVLVDAEGVVVED